MNDIDPSPSIWKGMDFMLREESNRRNVYDYFGRRVEEVEYDGNALTRRTRFAYMEYLMIASMDCTQNTSNPSLLGT